MNTRFKYANIYLCNSYSKSVLDNMFLHGNDIETLWLCIDESVIGRVAESPFRWD